MRVWRQSPGLAMVGLLAFAALAPALAQEMQPAPSPALQCLTPPPEARGQPVYPESALKDGRGAKIDVELEFRGPDWAPRVKVLDGIGGEFLEAVDRHVKRLRVPCMDADGPPVRLRQVYSFEPDAADKVNWTRLEDRDDPRRAKLLACRKHVEPGSQPRYPVGAQMAWARGHVVVESRFTSADGPPVLRSHADDRLNDLTLAAERWAQGWRLPCYDGSPVSMLTMFVFKLEDEPMPGFRDLTLVQFLGNVKGIRQQRVKFDFRTMGCPFEARVQYLQPHWSNTVGFVGPVNAARSAFAEWLSRAELDLKPRDARAVFGATASFTVPCTFLDLDPARSAGADSAAVSKP